jgi:hypothetical protein
MQYYDKHQPMVTASADLVISSVNEQALAILGESSEQLIGQRIDALIHASEAEGDHHSVYQTVLFSVPIASALPRDLAENNEAVRQGRGRERSGDKRALLRSAPASRNIHFDPNVRTQNVAHRVLPTYSHLFDPSRDRKSMDVLVVANPQLFAMLQSFTIKRTKESGSSDSEIDESDKGRKLTIAHAPNTRAAETMVATDKSYALILCPCDKTFIHHVRTSGVASAIVVTHDPDNGPTKHDVFEIGANGLLFLRKRGFFRTLGNILSDLLCR